MRTTFTLLISLLFCFTFVKAARLDYLGPDPDPTTVTYPLSECQGDCDRDEHCGWGLVCSGLKNKGDRVDGCDGFVGMDQVQFCMQDPAGRPNDNGAAVESVEVISGGATTGDEDGSDQSEQAVAAAETEEQQEEDSSSARAASILLTSTGVASLVVAVGFF